MGRQNKGIMGRNEFMKQKGKNMELNMNIISAFKGVFAMIGTFAGYFFGGTNGFFYAIVTFVVIDYITGVLCAIVNKQLSSEIGFKGIFKKLCIFILIGVANVIDMNVLNANGVLRTTVIFFYIANEGISIMENAASLGLPIPANLSAVLHQLKKKNDDEKGDTDKTEK